MVPVVAEVALEYRNTFAVAKLNNDENRTTIQKYRIIGQPIYIVFKDGEAVGRFVGAMPSAKLVERILGVLGIEETE